MEKAEKAKPVSGGGGTKIKSFRVSPASQSDIQCFGRLVLDTTGCSTLIIGSVVTISPATLQYVRILDDDGSNVIRNLTNSNNPQSVDVTDYDSILILTYMTTSGGHGSTDLNNIELR